MKVSAALVALALCLTQVNASPFLNKIGDIWGGAENTISNIGQGMKYRVSNTAADVKSRLQATRNHVENQIENAISGARDNINAATNSLQGGLSDDVIATMSPSNILAEAKSVSAKIDELVSDVQTQVEGAVEAAQKVAETQVSSWNPVVQDLVDKANVAGVDIKDCSVDRVKNMAQSTLKSTILCFTDKYQQAKTLVGNFIDVGKRAQALVNNIKVVQTSCAGKNGLSAVKCRTTELIPMLKEVVSLGTKAVSTSAQAASMVATLQTDLSGCLAKVATIETTKVPELTTSIATCVVGKIASHTAAAA